MTNEEKEAFESFKRITGSEEDATKFLEIAGNLGKVGEITRTNGSRIGMAIKKILKRIS